jgi:hypothetical protein
MPDTIAVPKVSPWRRCSRCDGKRVSTRPHGPRPTSGVGQTIARNARMRADQRALGFAQPGRKYNKGWCWRVPTCALAETSKRLARKSRTKAMTPAHKQAMTKTLLGLIAAFGVWLAPPEPPRPLLARQRDEHSSLARNYPGSIVARLLGLNRRPSVRAAGVAPTISRG